MLGRTAGDINVYNVSWSVPLSVRWWNTWSRRQRPIQLPAACCASARYIWARRAAPTLSVTPRRTYDLHSSCREANFDTRGVLRTTRRASLSPSTQRSAALSRPPSARGDKLMIGLKVGRTWRDRNIGITNTCESGQGMDLNKSVLEF